MMSNEIDNFFIVFRPIFENAKTLSCATYQDNFKKVALFSVFDMLSKALYGKSKGTHRKKFEDFILNFCEWENAENVSLQQLALALDKDPNRELDKLREYVTTLLNQFSDSQPIHLDRDPSFEKVSKLLPDGVKIAGNPLEYFKHVKLFYTLRNSLVHELRTLGYTFELFDEEEPYYTACFSLGRDGKGKLTREKKVFELVHPLQFYYTLLENGMRNGQKYCHEQGINPYENFKFGSEWL